MTSPKNLPAAAIALRDYLHENGISQAHFAVLHLGTTDSSLQTWLSGKGKPSLRHAIKIEKVAGIPVSAWVEESSR
jgi:DNA-binding transcriptional regulator YiaG